MMMMMYLRSNLAVAAESMRCRRKMDKAHQNIATRFLHNTPNSVVLRTTGSLDGLPCLYFCVIFRFNFDQFFFNLNPKPPRCLQMSHTILLFCHTCSLSPISSSSQQWNVNQNIISFLVDSPTLFAKNEIRITKFPSPSSPSTRHLSEEV